MVWRKDTDSTRPYWTIIPVEQSPGHPLILLGNEIISFEMKDLLAEIPDCWISHVKTCLPFGWAEGTEPI